MNAAVVRLFHFSEDPTIERFVPHVPRTNSGQPPSVWAIDAQHQSLYWFPRDCPRVAAWPRNAAEAVAFEAEFGTSAWRVHAVEARWLDRMRTVVVHRYELPAAAFRPWTEASGQWIAHDEIAPLSVEPVGDLLRLHEEAGIELRVVESLWPMVDLAVSDRWDFSIVRIANAAPRAATSS